MHETRTTIYDPDLHKHRQLAVAPRHHGDVVVLGVSAPTAPSVSARYLETALGASSTELIRLSDRSPTGKAG